MSKIQAQTSASKLRTAACPACVERTWCPMCPIRIGAAVHGSDQRGWGAELSSSTPSERLLSIQRTRGRKAILKSSHTPGLLFSWLQVRHSSLASHLCCAIRLQWILTHREFYFFNPNLSPDCPVQFSYWYKSLGLEARTHSGASSYWLAFQQLSETAATSPAVPATCQYHSL